MSEFYVASVTAFDERNQLDCKAQRKLYKRNIAEGAAGFFVGGSSAEFFLLSLEERIESLELAYEFSDQVDLIAHIGAVNTDEAIQLAQAAKRIGYSKISAIPPIYFGYRSKEICMHFKAISEAVELPIIYYNIPMNTHIAFSLDDDYFQELLKSEYLSGIKHTDNNLFTVERLLQMRPDLKIYGGLEQNMLSLKAIGVDSFIGSTFNFMLPHYKKLDYLAEHDQTKAIEMQQQANNIMSSLWENGLFASIKYILSAQGFGVGKVRSPFLMPDELQEKKLLADVNKNIYSGELAGQVR